MTNGIKDLRNLPLSDLIGAPLTAMIEAEAQAAQTTVDFIEQVGFTGVDKAEDEAESEEESTGELGPLRMVRFGYEKLDENGEPAKFEASIPLLALVPVPGVRIKTGKVGFSARINDVVQRQTSVAGRTGTAAVGQHQAIQLRGGFSPGIGGRRGETTSKEHSRGAFEIDIEVELESTPITVGVEKLLTTFDQAISEAKIEDQSSSAPVKSTKAATGKTIQKK